MSADMSAALRSRTGPDRRTARRRGPVAPATTAPTAPEGPIGRAAGWLALGVLLGLAAGFLAGLARPRTNQQQTGPMGSR